MAENNSNIRVAIRVRPLIAREKQDKAATVWEIKENAITQVSGSEPFCYDRVFGYEDDNEEVYTDLCFPIVRSVMDGFNGTIFAYGQTSSGKTFTMMGEHSGILKGLIHYTINDIFNLIQEMPDREFLLRVSFLEIYNERVYDLLSKKHEDLKLLEDGYGFVKVNGLQEKIVQTPDQILEWMCIGQKKRRTGETQMNRASSRSHSIFRMIIESRVRDNEDAGVNVSQLNLVDLAGSENVKQTKTKGDRFKEGIHINLSLSTLSQVISQLSEREDQFINYRNSKLTRLLQNSLGGNALTAIICTVTPTSLRETLSTLNFASRAKKIKNKPEKNEILTDQALLKQYANKIKKLAQELQASKEQGKELEEKTKQNENLKKQIENLKANFVSQLVPDRRNKAVRRETWGGRLDTRRIPVFEAQRKLGHDLNTLEEEAEDAELAEIEADFTLKTRKTSIPTGKISRLSGLTKNSREISTQTHFEVSNNIIKDYDDAMLMVSEFKDQLMELQNSYKVLTELTMIEQQCLKASDELKKEMEILKKENICLKEQITNFSKPLETNENFEESLNHPLSEVTNLKLRQEYSNNGQINSSVESQLNKAVYITNSSFNDSSSDLNEDKENTLVAEKPKFENVNSLIKSQLNEAVCLGSVSFSFNSKNLTNKSAEESNYLDETSKSHFLALYDECIESEIVLKLKEEVEMLKYDRDIKIKEINLLKDKVQTKEEEIFSLKNHIASFDNKIYASPGVFECESQIQSKDKEISLLKSEVDKKEQEISHLKKEIFKSCDIENNIIERHIQRSTGINSEYFSKDEEISLLKDELKIKERENSSLKLQIVKACDIRNDISVQTSMIEFNIKTNEIDVYSRDCQTSPLQNADHENLRKFKKEVKSLQYDCDLKEKQIDLLKDKIEIKEQMITSLKNEITLQNENSLKNIEKTDKSAQTSVLNYTSDSKHKSYGDFKIFQLFESKYKCLSCEKKTTCVQSTQTPFIALPVKNMFDIECQTSPHFSEDKPREEINYFKDMENVQNYEEFVNSPRRLSPLGVFLENTEAFENSNINEEQNYQIKTPVKRFQTSHVDSNRKLKNSVITPIRCKEKKSVVQRKIGSSTKETLVQTSPICYIKKCSCDMSTEDILNGETEIAQGAHTSTTNTLSNQSDEMKSVVNKIKELKSMMLELVDSLVEFDYSEVNENSPLCTTQKYATSMAEHNITTLKQLIKKLEFYIKRQKDYSDLIKEQLETRLEEVISLDLKFTEAESTLEKKNKLISDMSENIFKLNDSISHLALISSKIKYVRSKEELENIKASNKSTCLASGETNIVLHDLKLLQDIVKQINSNIEESALLMINLSEKLDSAKKELDEKKLACQNAVSSQSKSIQVDLVADESSAYKTLQLDSEIKSLREKCDYLENCNVKLKEELNDKENTLLLNYKDAKSDWENKTRLLIHDIETKYEKELLDQEEKLTEKFKELKEQNMREWNKRELEFRGTSLKIKSDYNEQIADMQREILNLTDKFVNEQAEKKTIRYQVEKEKEDEIMALKKKLAEMHSSYTRKMQKSSALIFTLEKEKTNYIEQISNLESELKEKDLKLKNSYSSFSNENISKISQERDLLLSKYERAKKHIHKLNDDLEQAKLENYNKHAVQTGARTDVEEMKQNFLDEIDQKKAKILSLESNNSSLVKEMTKLKDMLSLKSDTCKCKTNSKSSKADIPDVCGSYEKNAKKKIDHKSVPEAYEDQKFVLQDGKQLFQDPKMKDADQDAFCTGGGSGNANMVKCYWLEGVVKKKNKELAESEKKISELEAELKSLKECPVKKEIKKQPEVKVQGHNLDEETDGNVTIYNRDLHPFQSGAIPKVQPKHVLKEKNMRTVTHPYKTLLKTDTLKKLDADCNIMRSVSSSAENPERKITDLNAALLTGESECKQQ